MCIFQGQKPTRVEGLLQGIHDFRIPVTDEFGGDVIVGWRTWNVYYDGSLRSPVKSSHVWHPGKPMTSRGEPSTGTGRGIYCRDLAAVPGMKSTHKIWGEVALWGRVLDFPTGSTQGAMGEFGFPLSLYIGRNVSFGQDLIDRWAKAGVEIYNHRDRRIA